MEKEIVKRLAPTKDTLTLLFSLSGNVCAFPDCNKALFNVENTFVGQVCHIESARVGGERFNADSTNEERRQYSNLMVMCYEHHKVTDNVEVYPTHKMRQIKSDHENRFRAAPTFASQDQIDRIAQIELQKSIDTIRDNTEKVLSVQDMHTQMMNQILAAVQNEKPDKILKTDFDKQIDGIISLRSTYQHKAAIRLFQKMVDEDWENLSARERYRVKANLGILQLDLLEDEEAAKHFIDSYAYQPDDPKALGWAILGYSLIGDAENAKMLIKKGLEINPKDVGIYGALVRLNKKLPLKEIIEIVPPDLRQHAEVAFEIARAAQSNGDHETAITWGQIALDNASDSRYELRAVLGTIILDSIRSPYHVVTSQISHDTRSKAGYIVELYSQAWDEIKNTDLRESRVWFLINRSVARTYVEDFEGSYQDAKEALSHRRDSFCLRHVAIAAARTKREKEAMEIIDELKPLLSGSDLHELEHFHGQLFLQLGEVEKALDMFRKLLGQDISQSLRLFIIDFLGQGELDAGNIDAAINQNNLALSIDPNAIPAQLLKGKIALKKQEYEHAKEIFGHILSIINHNTPEVDIFDLSLQFEELKMNNEAIELMELVSDLNSYSSNTQKLLKLYFRAGEYGKLLSACHMLTEKFGPIMMVTELKAYVQAEINDFPAAISTCLEYLNVYPGDQSIQGRLALLYYRKEEWDKVGKIVDSIDHLDRTLAMDMQFKLAISCHDSGRMEKFRRFALQARRQFMDHVSAHENFIHLGTVISPEREHPENPLVVGIDCEVTIISGEQTIIYRIEDRSDLSRSHGELSPDSSEAMAMSGKKIGDEITLGPQAIKYTIIDILHIFNAALRESYHLIGTTFASLTSFRQMSVGDTGDPEKDFKAIFEALDRRSAADSHMADAYRKDMVPISAIAAIRNANLIMVWKNFISDERLGIFTAWDVSEVNSSFESLKTQASLMIDVTSLCTIAQIGGLNELKLLGLELFVSESSVLLIHEILHDLKTDSLTGKFMLGKEGDRYIHSFASPELIQSEILLFTELLSWIRENCKSLPCNAALKMNAEKKKKLNKNIGETTIDSILTAKEQASLLLVEETAIRIMAKAQDGVPGTASFIIWAYLFVNKKIKRGRYVDLTIGLLGINYKHIPSDQYIMLEAAKRANYRYQHPLPQATRGLLSPMMNDNFTVHVVCDYFISLYHETVDFVPEADINIVCENLIVNTLKVLSEKFLMDEFIGYIIHCLSTKIYVNSKEYLAIKNIVGDFCKNVYPGLKT